MCMWLKRILVRLRGVLLQLKMRSGWIMSMFGVLCGIRTTVRWWRGLVLGPSMFTMTNSV